MPAATTPPKQTNILAQLDRERYLSLETFKRNGDGVKTPVWFAGHHGSYFIFSAGEAGKVKRLRNNQHAQIAACNVSGKIHGDWLIASAKVLTDDSDIQLAHRALKQKYGWQMWLLDAASFVSGKIKRRAFIKVQVP